MPPITTWRLERLAGVTPNLHHVTVEGRPVFDGLAHPTVRRLTVWGDALPGVEPALVEHFEFAPRDPPEPGLLAPARWPRLRSLDLRAPFHEWFRFPLLGQLTHLRLREVSDEAEVQWALDHAPALVELRVDRAHLRAPRLRHPTARLVLPEPLPWPHRDHVAHRAVTLALPDGEIHLGLAETIGFLETATLSPEARDAWRRWWELVAELGAHGLDEAQAECSAAILERALAVDGLPRGWAHVRDQLRAAVVPLDVVPVTLYWA